MGGAWRMLVLVLVVVGGCLGAPPPAPRPEKGGATSPASQWGELNLSSSPEVLSAHLLPLMDDFWHWRTHDSPELATQVGVNDNTAGRLDTYTASHFLQRRKKSEEFLKNVELIEANPDLSWNDRLNLGIFKHQLSSYINNSKYTKYLTPVTGVEGPQLQLRLMVERWMTLASYNDFQKLLSRYGEFPRQADELILLMIENLSDEIMPYNESMTGVVSQFDALTGPVSESVFFKPFLHLPLTIPPEQRRTLRQQAQERIAQDLLPAFNKLKNFLKDEYLPHTRYLPGASSLPDGEQYYQACLRHHTSTSLIPRAIHNLGINEVKRIQIVLNETAEEIGVNATETFDLMEELRKLDHQVFSSSEEALKVVKKTIREVTHPLMDTMFAFLPSENLTVRTAEESYNEIPVWYERPSLDGSRPGVINVNTNNNSFLSQKDVTATALHLSYPGNHLQAAVLQATASIPAFRKVLSYLRLGDAPAKFPHHGAFVEGWGLYSEYLGEELQLYKDPYQRLGRINRELVAASSLVVDTGIHALGWNWERAFKYLNVNTPLYPRDIQILLRRVVAWPGRSCSAKIGEIKIKELRQRASNALGPAFNLLQFHDVMLQCVGPLQLLQECITQYISDNIQKPSERPETTPQPKTEPPPKIEPCKTSTNSCSIEQSWLSLRLLLLIILYYFAL